MTEVLKRQSKKSYNQVKAGFTLSNYTQILTHTLHLKHPLLTLLLSPTFLWQHILTSEVKVDKVQVNGRGDGTTFSVCLDQDEKKFIQSVTRYNKALPLTVISFHL